MSLYQAIKHGKEHRKSYLERGKPGEFDTTCRPHGGSNPGMVCPYCARNRAFSALKLITSASEQVAEYSHD